MFSKRVTFPRTVPLVAALVVALATAPAAWADDEAPTPKKVKVRVATDVDEETEVVLEDVTEDVTEERSTKRLPKRSPIDIIQGWMQSKLGEALATDDARPAQTWLKHWFEADDDVPMADLRDALTAEGWDADSMHTWLMGAMGRGGMGLFSRGGPRMHGPRGGARAPRTFTWFGQRGEAQPAPRVHTEQRAWILWHDGERWQRKALPDGTGGSDHHRRGQPRRPRSFRGPRSRRAPWHDGAGRGGMGRGQRGQGHLGGGHRPHGGPMRRDTDLEHLLRDVLGEDARPAPQRRNTQRGPRGARDGMHAGGGDLEGLLRMLERAQSEGADVQGLEQLRDVVRELRSSNQDGDPRHPQPLRGRVHVVPSLEGNDFKRNDLEKKDQGKTVEELMHALRQAQQRRSGLPRIRALREAIRKQRNEGLPGSNPRRGMIHVGPMPEGKRANDKHAKHEHAGGDDLVELLRMLQGLTKDGDHAGRIDVDGLEQLREALEELRGALGRDGRHGSGQRGEDGAPGTHGRAGHGGAGGRAAPKAEHDARPKPDVKRKKVRVVIER